MFGIPDPWIVAAYALCLLSALVCVIYGVKNWNRGGEDVPSAEDANWAKKEDELIETL